MSEKKFDWALTSLKQLTEPDPKGHAMFEAMFYARQLPRLTLVATFWGSPERLVPKAVNLPPARFHQAEAFIMATLSVPQSIEALSRIFLATSTEEAPAEGLVKER